MPENVGEICLSVIEVLEMPENVGDISDVVGGHFENLNDRLSSFGR